MYKTESRYKLDNGNPTRGPKGYFDLFKQQENL